jgi:hypothetical protein
LDRIDEVREALHDDQEAAYDRWADARRLTWHQSSWASQILPMVTGVTAST